MIRLKGWVLALAILGLFGSWAFAGDAEDEIEGILKKFDERYRKLREEMRKELLKAMGEKPTPAKGGAPYVGIDVEPVKEGLRVLLNLEKGEGLVIRKVVKGSPASEAGLRKWDILLGYNKKRVGSKAELKDAVGTTRPGDRIRLLVLRDGERKDLRMTVGSRGKSTTKPTPAVGEFLDETLRSKMGKVRSNLKKMIEGRVRDRMEARRFFEDLFSKAGRHRERIFKQIEEAAEDMLGKLSPGDRKKMRKVFKEMMGGFKHAVQKTRSSQKKEDIERFLEEMLGGKVKKPAKKPTKKDDIDKLLDDLLGNKPGKKPGKKKDDPKKDDDDLPVNIPPEWDKAMEDILGEEGWNRIKEMMKSPQYKEMLKQFFPEGFEFTPANVKKLLEQYGIDMESLPDRLREMDVEDEAIERIMKLLEEEGGEPAKKVKGWVGFRAQNAGDEGVLVTRVDEGGPASKAGLKPDDVIVKAGRYKVKDKNDLKKALKGRFAGDTLTLTVKRDKETVKIKVKLGVKK